MPVQAYHLAQEFVDPDAERSMLAALARDPRLYWQHVDLLQGAFSGEPEAWTALSGAITGEQPPVVPHDWLPAPDPAATAIRLADLQQRRMLADLQEHMARALRSEKSALELLGMFEEEVARTQSTVRELHSGKVLWASDLLSEYLAGAEARHRLREASGISIAGVPTGLNRVDELLNGLGTGLYILAGAPGAGKTTLALQMALHAARQRVPVVYVTYENSPVNLVGKALCATAGVSPSDTERGFANLAALRVAEYELSPVMPYLAIIEGTCRLTVAEVRAKALQAMNRHRSERCLVIVDYLQRAAHGQGFDGLRFNVSALAGELRDLANRLRSPVLALSSQSRAGGNYGSGGGSANLDSLKESGDLEYSADAVMFLKATTERAVVAPARAVDLVLAKNRFGDVGSVPLVFRADVGQLREDR